MKTIKVFTVVALAALAVGLAITASQRYSPISLVYLQEAINNTFHPQCPVLAAGERPLLPKGSHLEADTTFAIFQIDSIDDQTRKYRWRTSSNESWNQEIVKLKAGDGAKLSYPGNSTEDIYTFLGLKRNVIAYEGEQDCQTQTDFNFWLKNYRLTHGAVITKSGLIVGCDPAKPDFQVIQLKLNGRILDNLSGSDDAVFTISRKE